MRKPAMYVALAALAAVFLVPDLQAVPSFTRQTGMTCNQCHVSFGGPVPNFTFTGKKFRLNGYRMPFVAEKIEAGEEGVIGGKRLALPLAPYMSFRYQSVFAEQSRGPTATEWGPVSSNPTSRLSFFPGGAFGDFFGMWVELYLTPDGSTTREWTQGLFSLDEYDLRIVKVTENATVGFGFNNQSQREVGGFGPWPVGITNTLTRGGFGGWSHPNRGNLFLYGLFNDRVLAMVGASPGEDNLDWDRRNYQAQLGVAPFNSDEREMWVVTMLQFGDDGIPITTNVSPSRDGNATWRYRDAVPGISATRLGDNAGQPYLSTSIGDYVRLQNEFRYGFVDNGAHSMETAIRHTYAKETYDDNAEMTQSSLGGAIRYVYERTWGLDISLDKRFSWEFTDASGVVHPIGHKPAYTVYLSYRPAMNMLVALRYGNSQSNALDRLSGDVPTGRSWRLNVDILF